MDGRGASIVAAEVWGALYGLETFLQLVSAVHVRLPGSTDTSKRTIIGGPVAITDQPRYPWRGLMLDTANHFFPVETLLDEIDQMAANKMNVLHWHIVDSYSARPPARLKGFREPGHT